MAKLILSEYFDEEKDCYICNRPITEVRIPISFFEKKLAEFVLNEVDCLAVFYIYFYDNLDIENTKPIRLLCQLPMTIRMCPSDIIESTIDEEKHYILRFSRGDKFIKTRTLVKHVDNVEKAINLLFNNFIPDSIPYRDIYELIKNAKNINSINLKCSDQLLAVLVAESIRNPENLNQPFRMVFEKDPNFSEYKRKIIRLADIARLNDSFAGIASGNPARSITTAIYKHRNPELEKEQNDSPVIAAIS